MVNTHARETIDIETSGGAVDVTLGGRTIVEVTIRGDGAADYVIEGRESTSASWVTTPLTYSDKAAYDDTVEAGWTMLRVRCTAGTGIATDSAEIVLCAGGR